MASLNSNSGSQSKSQSSSAWQTANIESGRVEYSRPLGDSEYAYYVPAKQSFFTRRSPFPPLHAARIMDPHRIAVCWAVLRQNHPLLRARVKIIEEEPWFWFTPSKDAQHALTFNSLEKDELISNYLNGSRTLSDDKMSYMVISTPSKPKTYHLLLCAPHYIGDGSSLHQCAHDLFTLLDLLKLNETPVDWVNRLPPPLESRIPIPSPNNKLATAAAQVAGLRVKFAEVGNHTLRRLPFPTPNEVRPQKTVMFEKSFSVEQTKKILARCKHHGVTINHLLFALCGVAWGRTHVGKVGKDPLMMYTALNLRPYLTPLPLPTSSNEETYFFLALTYFNIVRSQVRRAAGVVASLTEKEIQKTWVGYRALMSATERAERVRRMMGRQAAASTSTSTLPKSINEVHTSWRRRARGSKYGEVVYCYHHVSASALCSVPSSQPQASTATVYSVYIAHGDVPELKPEQLIHITSVTTASRLKPSGLLILSHTFNKRLWMHLCWDVEGFPKEGSGDKDGGEVERFWEALGSAVEELCV
ncbi:hypothetical protein BT96DRAFT_920493 [Gymnopus androsaceus JB14]|uniref:Condensation domain-containing protein n=1 Tax=Gymnopus androsaceus JB14 TaxID=1447944 RepID=A0A6A4HMB9_9AGAR|nr:hypothetical protein BT96DRAFT_920493 [Gymnopus androsaceus JB14]